jgi:hypothetical protein
MSETSSSEAQRISILVGGKVGAELEGVVDLDIEAFDQFFQDKLGNAPLTKAERAAIKTFIWYLVNRDKGI